MGANLAALLASMGNQGPGVVEDPQQTTASPLGGLLGTAPQVKTLSSQHSD